MNKFALLTITILAAACGDNASAPTFADGVTDISVAFCEARVRCGWDVPSSVEPCVEFNEENLCEERYTCEDELTGEEEDLFALCVAELNTFQCGPFLPASCYEVLELR